MLDVDETQGTKELKPKGVGQDKPISSLSKNNPSKEHLYHLLITLSRLANSWSRLGEATERSDYWSLTGYLYYQSSRLGAKFLSPDGNLSEK